MLTISGKREVTLVTGPLDWGHTPSSPLLQATSPGCLPSKTKSGSATTGPRLCTVSAEACRIHVR
jgi:hypothetical protein